MLQISRADVVSTHIIEDLPNAFLKLSVTTYLKTLDVEPLPSQIALVNAINKYRFVVAALSRRQGKTYIANIIGQMVALVPGCNILIMSPNYSLSQISFELQRQLLKYHGIKPSKDNAKDKVIELENGSTIRMGSINQVDSSVGRSYDLIIFDEAALSDGIDAFNVALRPTLDKPGSRAIFISTPRGKTNWFSVLYNRGYNIGADGEYKEFKEWCSIRATWEANPRMTQEDIDEAKLTMSAAEFAQEYMADFNQYQGQIWTLSQDCIRELPQELPRFDIVAGLDLGFQDPTAMCVIGYDYVGEKFYFLDEYYLNGKTTAKHAEAIQRLINKWDIDYIYIDSAGAQTRYDLAREYDIPTMNANKSVLDGIGYVSSLVDNDQIYVSPHLKEVLRAFDAYRWDPNPNLVKEKPIHDSASHMADAIRYALYSFKTRAGSF